MLRLKTYFCVLIMFFITHNAFGQKWEFGLAGGLVLSKMSSDSLHSGIRPSGTAGFSIQYKFLEELSLRLEPAFLSRSARYKHPDGYSEKIRFENIVLPILYQYRILPGVRFIAGPAINIPVGVSVFSHGYFHRFYETYGVRQPVFLCFVTGADFDLGKGLVLNARYEKSLYAVSVQNVVIGLRFILGKGIFSFTEREPKEIYSE